MNFKEVLTNICDVKVQPIKIFHLPNGDYATSQHYNMSE